MKIICEVIQTFDVEEAIKKLLLKIYEKYPKKEYYLGIVFFTFDFENSEIFKKLYKINFVKHLFSLKVYKIIYNANIFSPGIGILLFPDKEFSEFLFFHNFEEKRFPDEAERKFFQLVKEKQFKESFVFHIIDAPLLKIDRFLRGVQNVLGTDSTNLGVSPFQDFSLESNQLYYNGKIYKNYIISLLFSKKVNFSFSQKIGALEVGSPFTITQSYLNLIEKINDKPASSYFLDFTGSQIPKETFPRIGLYYPVGLYLEDKIYLRNIIRFLDGGILFCGGEIEEHSKGRVFLVSNEEILKTCRESAKEIKNASKEETLKMCWVFSGISRLKSLGHKQDYEVKEIKNYLNAEIFGFYTHREISPELCKISKGKILFQNASINILGFLE